METARTSWLIRHRSSLAMGIAVVVAGLGAFVGARLGSNEAGQLPGQSASVGRDSLVPAEETGSAPTLTNSTETVADEYRPILMTATDPDELISQYVHNLLCYYNGPSQVQMACAAYLLGSSRQGALTDRLNERRADIDAYRLDHPEFRLTYTAKAVANRRSFSAFVIAIDMKDPRGEATKRLTFVPGKVEVVGSVVQNATMDAWTLVSEEHVEPGESPIVQ